MEVANSELQEQISNLQAKLDQSSLCERECSVLHESIKEHEETNETLKGSVEELQREKKLLEDRVQRLQAEFEDKLEGLTDKKELTQLSQVYQIKHDNLEKNIEVLESERARVQGELEMNLVESEELKKKLQEGSNRHADEVELNSFII